MLEIRRKNNLETEGKDGISHHVNDWLKPTADWQEFIPISIITCCHDTIST